MSTAATLLDINARAHASLAALIEHCGQLTPEELDREFDDVRYGNVRLQIHHAIMAQIYWISVLQGGMNVDEKEEDYATIEALARFRQKAQADVEAYLNAASEEELTTASPRMTWGNKEKNLIPIHVVMRTVTHIFQHLGQVLAMCRLMGKPKSGLDYPVE